MDCFPDLGMYPMELASQTLGSDLGKLLPRPWEVTLGSTKTSDLNIKMLNLWNLLPRPWEVTLGSCFPDLGK